jgi:hypothetical protein
MTRNTSLLALFLMSTSMVGIGVEKAHANRRSDPAVPLSHCYHWLDEASRKYLTYKYKFAGSNAGEITFYTTPGTSNGAVAGPGLYCGKTPIDSIEYGDRVIRVDFVDDVIVSENGVRNHCGLDGKLFDSQAECDAQTPDVILYSGGAQGQRAWYLIKNPAAVAMWTANDDRLAKDLEDIKADGGSGERAKLGATIGLMGNEAKAMGKKTFVNGTARFSGLEKLKKSPSPNNLPALDKDVRAALDRKALITVGGGAGKVGFLFAGDSDKEIAAQCSTFVNAFKNSVMAHRQGNLRVYLNREGAKAFALNLKSPSAFCDPVVSSAGTFMAALRAKQKLIADMRNGFGRANPSPISVDLAGDHEKLNIADANEQGFMEKCMLAHDSTKISLTRELSATIDGETRSIRHIIMDDPGRFCKRVALEIKHKRLNPSAASGFMVGSRAPGMVFALPLAGDKAAVEASCKETLSLYADDEKRGMNVMGYRLIEHRGDDAAFCASAAASGDAIRALADGKYLVHGTLNKQIDFDFVVGNQYELECECRKFLRSKYSIDGNLMKEPVTLYVTEVVGRDKQWQNTNSPWAMDRVYHVCSMVRDQTFDRYDYPVEEAVGNRICPRE